MAKPTEHTAIRKRRNRRLLILGLLVLLVAGGVYYRSFLNNYATMLIGETFKKTVQSRSKGLYHISYDSLQINILEGTASLHNFSVSMDSSRLDEVERDVVFTAHVSHMTLKIKNLLSLPLQDRLRLELVVLDNPKIRLIGRGESRPTLSGKSGYLYRLLAGEIRNFNVDELFLKNGVIDYLQGFDNPRGNFSVKSVNMRVRNLTFRESEEQPELSTGDIFLAMSDQQFLLSDSLHKLLMDSLIISSADSLIRVKNLQLLPLNDSIGSAHPEAYNLYRLQLPELLLSGVDFSRAYQENYMHIGQITLRKPDFFMESPSPEEKNHLSRQTQNHLAKMAAEMFNVVAVNTILLDSGSFEVFNEGEKSRVFHKGPLISARLRGFTLDTLNYKELANHINIDSGRVVVENYSVDLPDSLHVLELRRFSYQFSDASDIQADSIHVFASGSENELRELDHWDLLIPHASLNGLDVDAWLDNNRLLVAAIKLQSPTFSFNKNTGYSESKARNEGSVKPLFLMQVGSAEVGNGKLQFYRKGNPYIMVDGLQLALTDMVNDNIQHTMQVDDQTFQLKAASAKMWPGNDFFLNLENLSLVNQNTSRIRVETASLYKEHTVDATFDDLELSVSTLSFTDPDLAFTDISSNRFDVLVDVAALKDQPKNQSDRTDRNSLELLNMYFTNGSLSIRDGGKAVYSAAIDTLDVAELILTSSPTIDGVELYSHNNVLHQKRSPIYFTKLYLSQYRDSLSVTDLFIEEGIETSLPHIAVNGLVFDKIFDSKGIEASKMVLFQPEIVLSDTGDHKVDTLNFADFAHQVDSVLGPVSVDSLLLTEAIVHHSDFLVEDIRLLFLGVNINEENVDGKKIPFVDNVEAQAGRFSFTKGKFFIEAQNLQASLQENFIKSDSLKLIVGRDSILALSMPASAFSFFDMQDFLLQNRIKLDRIAFFQPQVSLNIPRSGEKRRRNVFEEVLGKETLEAISIDTIQVHSASLDLQIAGNPLLEVGDASMVVSGLALSESTNLQKNMSIFSDIQFSGSDICYLRGDSLTDVTARNLDLSYADSTLSISGLMISPVLSKNEWVQQVGAQRDWLHTYIGGVILSGLHMNSFLSGKGIFASALELDSAALTVYKDRRIERDLSQKKPMLQERFLELSLPVNISGARVENSTVAYTETGEKSGELGIVDFTDFTAWASNLTNQQEALKLQPSSEVFVQTKFMDAAPLEVALHFELASNSHNFRIKGRMAQAPLPVFNKITRPALLLDVQSGLVDTLSFSFEGDSASAVGKMRFLYHDLKIGFLRPHKSKPGFTNRIAAFIANSFVIRSDNPGLFNNLRQGTIKANRHPGKSSFSYWTQAVLSGILSSVGLKPTALKPEEAVLKRSDPTE